MEGGRPVWCKICCNWKLDITAIFGLPEPFLSKFGLPFLTRQWPAWLQSINHLATTYSDQTII